jgi:hypothetical protein
MTNSFNKHSVFIFHIIDEGLLKRTISDFDLRALAITAEGAISSYLTDHGSGGDDDEELKTDDGYANIIRSIPGDPDLDESVWSYSFDGEISLRYAFQELNSQIDAGISFFYSSPANPQTITVPNLVIISDEELRERVYVAVGNTSDGTYFGLSNSSTLTESNPIILANSIVKTVLNGKVLKLVEDESNQLNSHWCLSCGKEKGVELRGICNNCFTNGI